MIAFGKASNPVGLVYALATTNRQVRDRLARRCTGTSISSDACQGIGQLPDQSVLFLQEIQSVIQTDEVLKGFAHYFPHDVGYHFQRIEYRSTI
jgi:hypothetical protein